MSIGNIDNGKRRILNNDNDTKAVSASRTLFSSTKTKTAKVTKDTWMKIRRKYKGKWWKLVNRMNKLS